MASPVPIRGGPCEMHATAGFGSRAAARKGVDCVERPGLVAASTSNLDFPLDVLVFRDRCSGDGGVPRKLHVLHPPLCAVDAPSP